MGGIGMSAEGTNRAGRRQRRRRGRFGGGPLGALLALALAGSALTGLAGTAHADGTRSGGSDAAQLPADADATARAQAQAQSSDEPVVVDELTTAYAQTVANPDGTLTETSSAAPVRAKVNGGWAPVDAGLQAGSDGTLSTKASVNKLTLSGGGTAPLATLTSPGGATLAITMPFALPAPTVHGDTAHYPDVLPDVDLDVTANEIGGIREILVVKTAEAASNPALATLHLATSGAGLTMQADAAGNLQAVDAAGNPAFVAPAPMMWDSSGAATAAPAAKSGAEATALATTEAGSDPSTPEGPGTGARTAAIPVTAAAAGVDLRPVAGMLSGSDTHYPVFIDPSYIPWDPGSPTWTWIQSAYPSSSDNYGTYGTSHSSQPGVGICGTYPGGGSCSPADKERSYFQFNTSTLVSHNDIVGTAVLNLTQTYSADWSCTNKYGLKLYYSHDTIGHGTTWSSHPADTYTGLTDNVGGTGSSGCMGDVPFAYTVTSTVKTAVESGNWNNITFGVYGDESDANGLKRLSNQATLAITYDHTPNVPTGMTSTPLPHNASTGSTSPCYAATNPTADAFVGKPAGTTGLVLKATVSSPTSPAQPVRGDFSVWDDSVTGTPVTPHGSGYSSGYASSGSQVSFTVPQGDFTDGHAYGWNVSANDGLASSAASGVCHFRADFSPPTVSMPTADDQVGSLSVTFPPAGNGQTTGVFVGGGGWVPFTAADPTPAVGVASGLACGRWSFDPELADAAWQCGANLPGSSGLAVFPGHWGTNILYVQFEDRAGNLSGIATYAFYVPWNPHGPAPVFGDTTGDGSADIVAAGNTDGGLYEYTVPGNTQATSPATSFGAKAADSPAGDAWKNYRITHRGSLRGGLNVDDLIVHKDGSPELDFYYNPGNTATDGRFDKKSPLDKPACVDDGSGTYCSGYPADWSKTLQIAALGDVSSAALDAGHFRNRTGLLTTETNSAGDAALWFYPTVSDGTLGRPVRLAATGWKNLDLISPGDWNASGRPGVWARDRTTGVIDAYAFTTGTLTPTDVFGDPLGYTVPTLTGISAGTQIGVLSVATAPLIGSDGDLNGDGIADLWSVATNGAITFRPGKTTGGTSATAVSSFAAALAVGATTGAADQWSLQGSGNDTGSVNPATAVGGVTWAADRTGRSPGAAVLDGSTGYLHTAGPALNTTLSYTVSAWVKLDSTAVTQTAVSQGTVNHQAFYLGYYTTTSSWYFMTTTSDAATTSFPTAHGGKATTGTWTHLTAVYDASSDIMSLYVNGVLASTAAANSTPVYNPSAPLTVGGNITLGSTSPYNQFDGSISDVRTFASALTADEVHTVFTSS
nr:hypothetical protein OH826_29495 [Streptomyces sp. NBC_00899]